MTCDHMSTTYTTSCGNTSDCHAGRCGDLYVSRRECAVLTARRVVEYEEPVKYLVPVVLLMGLAVFVIYQDLQLLVAQR